MDPQSTARTKVCVLLLQKKRQNWDLVSDKWMRNSNFKKHNGFMFQEVQISFGTCLWNRRCIKHQQGISFLANVRKIFKNIQTIAIKLIHSNMAKYKAFSMKNSIWISMLKCISQFFGLITIPCKTFREPNRP